MGTPVVKGHAPRQEINQNKIGFIGDVFWPKSQKF